MMTTFAYRLPALLLAAALASPAAAAAPRHVKVLLIGMFAQEAAVWTDKLKLDQAIPVPGLSPTYPAVRCNRDDVCQLTTDMGKANAAASVAALVHSGLFDLRQSYFIVAGVAGVDPAQGTIGTAAWSRYLVDSDLAWEVDARERPAGWSTGYLGIGAKTPGVKPALGYGTEVYRLNEGLLNKALELSRGVALADSAEAAAYRAQYPSAPANQPPQVTQCDSLTGNNWFHGDLLGQRARDWVALLTDQQGSYCMSSQEDNATYTALMRGAEAGLLDAQRVAVLRAASNFDRPHPGQTALASLTANAGGFPLALQNLYRTAHPLVQDIVQHWPDWKGGAPLAKPARVASRRAALAPKVVIINMFAGEAAPFISELGLTTEHPVPGLSARYPALRCDRDDVCQVTTDMGYSNAASSVAALLYASGFDLRHTYFIIAGIAGINPKLGTVGSTAWADYAVDFSLLHEIDAREMPQEWASGYFGIHTNAPDQKPVPSYRTEVFQLNPELVTRAYQLSKNVTLGDSPAAIAYRANFDTAPANQLPAVLRCDTASTDTWFGGAALAGRAETWSALLTDGQARYCTAQQEDNSTLEVLRRGGAAGKVDFKRVLILRAGSDVDRPHPGQSDSDVLLNYTQQGGFAPAAANLALTARPVIRNIVGNWAAWKRGVPRR
nr:purine nucleoside permease [Duganella vulcania]